MSNIDFSTGDWMLLIVLLSILDVVLRGFALWRSARLGQTVWFVSLMIINSVGILPGIYLLLNRRVSKKVK